MDNQIKDTFPEDIRQTCMNVLSGKQALGSLDPETPVDNKAIVRLISERPSLLATLDKDAPNGKAILELAINQSYSNFIYLTEKQYYDKIAQIFFAQRLKATSSKWNGDAFTLRKSLDGKLVIVFNYVSHKGEEVYYFDKELHIPAALLSEVRFSVKLKNACKFFDFLDIDVASINLPDTLEALSDLVNTEYRHTLQNFLDENGIGFYALCGKYTELKAELCDNLNAVLAPFGAEVTNIVIQKISFADNMHEAIKEEYYSLQKERIKKEMENELAELSLAAYEKKAEIHSRYPDFPVTLTEAEKDFALKRYLIRTEKYNEEKPEIDKESVTARQITDYKAAAIKKKEEQPVIIEEEVPVTADKKKFIIFISLFAVCLLTSLFSFIGSIISGIILTILTLAVFGTIFFAKKSVLLPDKNAVKKVQRVLNPTVTTANTETKTDSDTPEVSAEAAAAEAPSTKLE